MWSLKWVFDIYSNKDGYPSASIVLKQNFGTNASLVISRTKEKLNELKGFSTRHGLWNQLRRFKICKCIHWQSSTYIGWSICFGSLGCLSIFGRLAVNFDTHYSGTGVVDRCFCIYAIVWTDDKPDNTVCISAGHWYCGRWRHSGSWGRPCQNGGRKICLPITQSRKVLVKSVVLSLPLRW